MSDYPEHDKMNAVKEESQAIGEFLTWAEGEGMILYHQFARVPVMKSTNQLLADYYGIDLDEVNAEKRRMIQEIREKDSEREDIDAGMKQETPKFEDEYDGED